MFDKLTDLTKFFIGLIIYTVAVSYWAGGLTANVEAQTVNLTAQTLLLSTHIEKCQERVVEHTRLEEEVSHLKTDIDHLLRVEREKEAFDGLKKR